MPLWKVRSGLWFLQLLCHAVLPYSNWGWITVCYSESMLALRRWIPAALAQLGRILLFSQTDNSTSTTHKIAASAAAEVQITGAGEEKATTHRTRSWNLKGNILGVCRWCSKRQLSRYLAEFQFPASTIDTT